MPSHAAIRRQKEREEALEKIAEQVASGRLTIRKMTKAEREKWGPAPSVVSTKAKRIKRSKSMARNG